MSDRRRTWRMVDGERIEGTWQPAFVRNNQSYILTDLRIYADGTVDCHGLMTIEEFAAEVSRGDVTTNPPDGARLISELMSCRVAEPHARMAPEAFLGRVRDSIERLNGRPDAEERCLSAADVYVREPTEANLANLRADYAAVPEPLALYAFTGDGPYKGPDIRVLVAGLGNPTGGHLGTEAVTEDRHAEAMRSLARHPHDRRPATVPAADDPVEPVETSIVINEWFTVDNVIHSIDRARPPHVIVLRNEYPAPITVDGKVCPTVAHAYWALSVTDKDRQADILHTASPRSLAAGFPRRDGWPQMRTAVMAELLRAKFAQHPELAEVLLATGASRLIYSDVHSRFWGQAGNAGRNWMGRLLELVRSEHLSPLPQLS